MHRSPVSRAFQFAPLCCSPRSGASKRETQLPQTALPVCGQSATAQENHSTRGRFYRVVQITQENRPLVLVCTEDTQYHSPESLQRHPLVLGKSFVHAPGRKTKKGGEMDTMSISGTSEPGAGREASLHCSPMQPRWRICADRPHRFSDPGYTWA